MKVELKEIALRFPLGSGKKLVCDPTSKKWMVANDRTGACQVVAPLNSNYINSAIAATAEALTFASEATSDKERLDWVAKNSAALNRRQGEPGYIVGIKGSFYTSAPTLREAIDMAMGGKIRS